MLKNNKVLRADDIYLHKRTYLMHEKKSTHFAHMNTV